MQQSTGAALAGRASAVVAIVLSATLTGWAATDPPRARLIGFSPLVAITTSDRQRNEELEWEHDLHFGYAGNPLNGTPETHYTVGVLDSGASVNLIGAKDAEWLGVVGEHVTNNYATVIGSAGEMEVPISQPIGVFAQGLSAISNGRLDSSQLLGHSNVATITLSPDSPDEQAMIPSVIGIPFMAFYTSVIRNDLQRTVTFRGEEHTSPDVRLYVPGDPEIPNYKHDIPMQIGGLGGLPGVTAAYSALDTVNLDFKTPLTPTLLTAFPGSIPTGGAAFATMNIGHGEITPKNPVQQLDMMVDTGAQASIISRAAAANLNVDLDNPDFTQDILGIGGIMEDVPGFFIDYVKFNAGGGALEFSRAPFLVLDLQSPAGGNLDGVLGMNFFWNRNVIFDPGSNGAGFFSVSEPLFGPEVLLGDVDLNLVLDDRDIDDLFAKRGGPLEEADPAVYDLTGDHLIDDLDVSYLVEEILDTRAGDANLDGKVDLADFTALKHHFGQAGGWGQADFTGDGSVELADFIQLKENFGFRRAVSPAAVPEPAAWLLAVLGFLGAALLRARQR